MSPDPAAFLARIEQHRRILAGIANGYCRDRESRDDVVQEMIVQLWRAYPRYHEARVTFSTWMYRIALNVAISFYRSQNRYTLHKAGDEQLLAQIPSANDTADNARNEQVEFVRGFIAGLDPLNRAVMLLYLEERSYAEIADILGISETNVGTKIGRIKQQLKRAIGADPGISRGSENA